MKKSILSYIGYLKKNQRIWFIISVVLYLLLSGFLYAISMTCFVNSEGSNLLTSGMSGLALIISRYILPMTEKIRRKFLLSSCQATSVKE